MQTPLSPYAQLLSGKEQAVAKLSGSKAYPGIRGTVHFYQTPGGVLVAAKVNGLPYKPGLCQGEFYAFHIHTGNCQSGEEAFSGALGHYNPNNCPHPQHAGDLPPLLGNKGEAFLAAVSGRFTLPEVLNRAVVIHRLRDDFTTQPGGGAGERIACGLILPV